MSMELNNTKQVFAVMYHNKSWYKFNHLIRPRLFRELGGALNLAKKIIEEHNKNMVNCQEEFIYEEPGIIEKYSEEGIDPKSMNYIATTEDDTISVWIDILKIYDNENGSDSDSD